MSCTDLNLHIFLCQVILMLIDKGFKHFLYYQRLLKDHTVE